MDSTQYVLFVMFSLLFFVEPGNKPSISYNLSMNCISPTQLFYSFEKILNAFGMSFHQTMN